MTPDNLDLLKGGLTDVVASFRRAFIERPFPEGEPRSDVFIAAEEFLDLLGESIPPLVRASNDLFDRLLPQGVGGKELNAGIDALRQAAAKLVDVYHDLWRRPFPPGLEMGQILLANVFERLLRDYLRALEQTLSSLEKSSIGEPSQAEMMVTLEIDEEAARLNDWLERTAVMQRRELVSAKGFGLGALAVSFALGWLFGDGD